MRIRLQLLRLIEMMGSSAPQIHVTAMRHYRLMLGYTRRKPAIWAIDTEHSAKDRLALGSTRVIAIQSGCLWMKLLSVHVTHKLVIVVA